MADRAPIKQFKCGQCGGNIEFHPGTGNQKCPYCGFENAVPESEEDIEELDFHAVLSRLAESEETVENQTLKCNSCGASTTLEEGVAADACPFCGSDVIVVGGSVKELKPKSLLPFAVTREEARSAFQQWIKKLWFAPNSLKQAKSAYERLTGLYVPYWIYDCDTISLYRGERGDDYYTTETYTTTENGKTVTKTRQVKRTRWWPVSGTVWNDFNDVLVLASRSLPKKQADLLEPWDLHDLVPFSEEYLSGFRTESYQVSLDEGMDEAREIMAGEIRQTVRHDIGGDHQRIHSLRTQYSNVTFKHILLPIWLSAYRYRDKAYRFLVNARTGEVQGERPWSWVKITLTVLLAIGIIAGIVLATRS